MPKKLDFLFLYVDSPNRRFEGFTYCTGTAKIIWKLRSSGYTAEQFISTGRYSFQELASTLKEKSPRFLGVTCYDDDFPMVVTIARHLKQIAPDITVVLGGPAVMFTDEIVLEHYPEIDMCVRGEGEYACRELLEADSDLSSILGLTYRANGTIIRNPDRPAMSQKEMNSFPSIYSEGLVPVELAWKFGVHSSRGCVFRCTFCHCSALTHNRVRFYDEEIFLDEIDLLIDHYRSAPKDRRMNIFVCDEAFTINRKRALRLCSQLAERELPFSLACITRGDLVDEEVLKALYTGGVRSLGFGLETAVPGILYNVGKARRPGDTSTGHEIEEKFLCTFEENVSLAMKIGFQVFVEVIVGLPGETPQDAITTIETVKRLEVVYQHHALRVFRGTKLWRDHERYGISVRKYNNRWHMPLETHLAYDVRNVPVLWDQEIYLQRSLTDEVQAVVTACTGIGDGLGDPRSQILCHGTPDGQELRRGVGGRFRLGSRFLFLDTDYPMVSELLSDYLFPLSPPIFLTRSACHDSDGEGIKLIRQSTPLDEFGLSFEVRVKTLSDLLSLEPDGTVTVGNDSVQSLDEIPSVDLVIPTIQDTDLLDRLQSHLNGRNSIVFLLNPSALRTVYADHCLLQAVSPDEGTRRELLDKGGRSVPSFGSFFPDLDPLVTAMAPESIVKTWQVLRLLVLAPQVLRGLTEIYRGEDSVKGCVQISLTSNPLDTGWVYGSFEDQVIRYSMGKSMLQVMGFTPGVGIQSARCLVRCFDSPGME